MKKFDVSTDSTADLYYEEIKKDGIYFVPLNFTIESDGKLEEFSDNFKTNSEYITFYERLQKGDIAKTSMLNLHAHIEHFKNMAKSGVTKAIHFTISYALSPTVDVANSAVEIVKKDYPNFDCICIESHSATIGQGFLVKIAVDMRNKGCSLLETAQYCNEIKLKLKHYFIVDNLMHLKRGGRISSTRAFIGTILNLKPILSFNKSGSLELIGKANGMKKAIKNIATQFEKFKIHKNHNIIYIVHSGNELLAKNLADEFSKLEKDINCEIRMVGPVIGSHLGPNAVGYGFISE